jgi:hypothetical protein
MPNPLTFGDVIVARTMIEKWDGRWEIPKALEGGTYELRLIGADPAGNATRSRSVRLTVLRDKTPPW